MIIDILIVLMVVGAGLVGFQKGFIQPLLAELLFVGTLLSARTWKYGEGRQLEDLTYVQERGPEAGVAHHYCDEAEARALLSRFDVDSLALDEFSDDEGHRHSHWQFIAIRRRR